MYFSPPPCDIDTGKLDQAAEDMLGIVSRITGKNGNLEALFNSAAREFSDLIAEDIYATANDNHSAWTSALTVCWHVWGVLTKWSGDVDRYKSRIAGLQEEWDAALRDNFGLPPDDAGVIEARRGLAGVLNDRAAGYWETLEGEAGDNSANLRGGPTVENLRELIDAGVLGFAAYNSTREILYYPATFGTGGRDAENLLPYLTGEKEPDDEYHRLMDQLAAVNALAMDAKRNGEKPLDYQIEYLEEFYAALDEASEGGVVGLPDRLDGDHLTEEQRNEVLGTLGDGLLTLSDQSLGGGYDVLPESVRDVVEGPDFSSDMSGRGAPTLYQAWQEQAAGLNELLSHADEELEGGAEFSTRLMDCVGREAERLGMWGDDLGGDDGPMSGLLEVATRNDDANYALLTGEYPPGVNAGLPWGGENAEDQRTETLEHLYTYDWGDDGAAIRGITDWIAEGGPSTGDDDTAGGLRETALLGLMGLLENEDFRESMFGTGEHVEDEDGNTWHNVSAGHLNPQLADGFADIFISFQDAFANTDGLPDNVELGHGESPEIPAETRMAFTQLVVADPDAAVKVYVEAAYRTAEAMEEYSTNVGDRDYVAINDAASLQGLVEVALLNESVIRGSNDEDFIDYRNRVNGAAINALGGIAGDQDVSGLIVEIAKTAMGEAFRVSGEPAEPRVEVNGDWVDSERMMGYALGAAAERDPELMEELEEEGIARRNGSGEIYVPPDHSTWGLSGSDSLLSQYYSDIDDLPWPDGESDTREAVEDFIRDFQKTGNKWGNVPTQ